MKTLSNYTKRTLGAGNLVHSVVLPPKEDVNEWLAANTVDFFNELSVLYSIVSDIAPNLYTQPGKGFPPGFEYRWADNTSNLASNIGTPPKGNLNMNLNLPKTGFHQSKLKQFKQKMPGKHRMLGKQKSKRLIRCTCWAYVDYVLAWVEDQVNNEKIFPIEEKDRFPQDFIVYIKDIFKRMFRVYAIIYTSFFDIYKKFDAVKHLNTSFKHFMFFAFQFKLISDKEVKAMKNLVDRLLDEFVAQSS